MCLTLSGICKRYAQKTVLDGVSLAFAPSRLHALFGENGAGKSTLVGIMAGMIQPDGGTMLIDQTPVRFGSAKDAIRHGIVLVHQTPLLAPELTVMQNVLVSTRQTVLGTSLKIQAECLQKQWAPGLRLSAAVANLGGNQRFYASLLCALLKKPGVLILDEPGAFLDAGERAALYRNLHGLCEQGATVIVITHSAAEAQGNADTVTVLHDGAVVRQFDDASQFSIKQKAVPFPGRGDVRARLTRHDAQPCLSLDHVSCRPRTLPPLFDVSLQADCGGITAVTGMQEPSMETLEELACGFLGGGPTGGLYLRGTMRLFGDGGQEHRFDLARRRPSTTFLRRNNVAIVPSDRKFRASCPELTVHQMLLTFGFEKRAGQNAREFAQGCIDRAGIQATPWQKASELSGGMLQRLILEREKTYGGRLFILCNPMQGLDTASQARLMHTMLNLASQGAAVLVLGAADVALSECARVYSLEGGTCVLSYQQNRR